MSSWGFPFCHWLLCFHFDSCSLPLVADLNNRNSLPPHAANSFVLMLRVSHLYCSKIHNWHRLGWFYLSLFWMSGLSAPRSLPNLARVTTGGVTLWKVTWFGSTIPSDFNQSIFCIFCAKQGTVFSMFHWGWWLFSRRWPSWRQPTWSVWCVTGRSWISMSPLAAKLRRRLSKTSAAHSTPSSWLTHSECCCKTCSPGRSCQRWVIRFCPTWSLNQN